MLFLTLDDIIESHQNQIDTYGGSHGIRDIGLLESAIAQPEASFGGQYLHADIFEMAAAYLFHLVMNHPFVAARQYRAAANTEMGWLSRSRAQ